MGFFTWFVSRGLLLYADFWLFLFRFVFHFFSIPALIRTLFSPWKRLVSSPSGSVLNIGSQIESLSFNIISRGMGVVVRVFLIGIALVLLALVALVGAAGFIVWVFIPFLSLPAYFKWKNSPPVFAAQLISHLRTAVHPLDTLFSNPAGKFVLDRTGLHLAELKEHASRQLDFLGSLKPNSYADTLQAFLDHRVWPDTLFRRADTLAQDLVTAARWWDSLYNPDPAWHQLGGIGIGLDLIFGYTPHLDQYALPVSFTHHPSRLVGRDKLISRMERTLAAGSSVVLVGPPGVGKKTLLAEFSRRSSLGHLGSSMASLRILELNFNHVLSASPDVNVKKTILRFVFEEAASAGNVILIVRDLERLTTSWLEGFDFTDIVEKALEKKDLRLIALASSADYDRFLAPNMRLRKSFETIQIEPLDKNESAEILLDRATELEKSYPVTFTLPAIRKIMDDSVRYFTDVPFPESALELLGSVAGYRREQGGGRIVVDDVSAVLAEKTGIPFSHLSGEEKVRLGRLEEIMKERLVGQDLAVSLIARSLRSRAMGVGSDSRPVGSFLFLGPTGVGKTETAKVLAKVYYGDEKNILRFDMAEYAGHEGITRLIGSVDRNQPGVLITAIKKHSAGMLLLDEIEKAPPEIFNLFLTMLDEGYITDAFGRRINCQHLFVIATSNAGSELIRRLVTDGVTGENLQRQVLEHVLMQRIFSPEFLNRFDGVVVYQPLEKDHLAAIARLQLQDLVEKLEKKHVELEITDEVCMQVASDGFNPTFGARPMRRIIDLVLADVLSKAFLAEEIKPGDKIKIVPGSQPAQYSWQKVG